MKAKKTPDPRRAGNADADLMIRVLEAIGGNEHKLLAVIELMDALIAAGSRPDKNQHSSA